MGRGYIARAKSSDWETPQDLFDKLDASYHFSIDVCATSQNAKCERYFTPEDDGLSQDWGRAICWMNPPYGRELGKWMKKAVDAAREGAIVVCLVPVRSDTKWWHEFVPYGVLYLLKGRLKFGGQSNSAPFPSALIVFDCTSVKKQDDNPSLAIETYLWDVKA